MSARAPVPPAELFEPDAGEAVSAKHLKAADSVAQFAAAKLEKLKRPRKFVMPAAKIREAVAGMHGRIGTGEWEGASGAELVAVYAHLHERIYGSVPSELNPGGWALAAKCAGAMITNQFAGRADDAVRFLLWLWRREEEREKWRRDNGRDGGRIGWRAQFCFGSYVDDYRVSLARRNT
jgi:hypothetical protein